MIRCRLPELMDQPFLDEQQHAHGLQSLNRINRVLGVDRGLYSCIRQIEEGDRLSVLDLGSGGGGFLGYIASRNANWNDQMLLGLDKSAFALRQAGNWQGNNIRWIRADALHMPLADNSVDWVTSSLFLHHFDEEDVVNILREASRVARKGVVIGDLTRSRLALVLTCMTTRLTSRSRVFHIDGPRSVRAAFRPSKLEELAESAGLSGAKVTRRFPFRMILSWRKASETLDDPIKD